MLENKPVLSHDAFQHRINDTPLPIPEMTQICDAHIIDEEAYPRWYVL